MDADAEPGARDRALLGLLHVLPSLEKEMLLLRRFVRPGDVCLDIGASYGIYTVPLARLCAPHGRVHSFEPRPRSARVLELASRAFTSGNVHVHRFALGDRDGTETLVTPRRRWLLPVPGRTFLKADLRDDGDYYDGWRSEFGGATERVIDLTSVDAFARRAGIDSVAFVKVDVEGVEQQVFRGAEETIERDRPVILCELEDRHTRKYGHRADDVLGWLAERGYRVFVLDGTRLRETASVDASENNYYFLP